MPRLFGTDGVRGVANRDLTPDLVLALGRAAGLVLAPGGGRVVVGRDTRLSGPMLEGALVAGLASAGAEAVRVGIIPTPAVAFLTLNEAAAAGAVISASHNPVADNGVKFFSADGLKTPGDIEDRIEQVMQSFGGELPTGDRLGGARDLAEAGPRYIEHLLDAVGPDLRGLRVVLDCAFGAAYDVGPAAFRAAGASLVALNDRADGRRINVDCGSTSMAGLAQTVVAEGAALGLALDGDADRVLAVDERGVEVDGDQILGMSALCMHRRHALDNDVVVATVMSNLGMIRAVEAAGIEVITAPVGDKFVAEAMAETGAVLGGEQSGHVIFAKHATTGDGLLTGLHVAQTVRSSGRPLSELVHFFEPYPQVLISVPVHTREALDDCPELWDAVAAAQARLGEDGRVLVRASGTEPVVRVLVEAAGEGDARREAEGLADEVRRLL